MHPGTLDTAQKSVPSASGSNERGSNGRRSTHGGVRAEGTTTEPWPSAWLAARPRGRGERAASAALAGPGPSRASPRARRKVSSQSPRHPLVQPTAEHNRLAAQESSRPGRSDGTLGLASLSPRGPPRFTYHRAGRRAAAGRAAGAAASVASVAAAGARPQGEKRRKVVLCRLRDTAKPAPGSAPFPTLPPARSHASPHQLPQPRLLRLWAAAAAAAAVGRQRKVRRARP